MAPQHAPRGQIAAAQRAVAFEGLQGVVRTGRFKAARTTQPRTEEETIGAHWQRQQTTRPECEGGSRSHAATARANNSSSSLAAAWRSASDAALRNCRASNDARSRITHWPAGILGPWRSIAVRICRFNRLRVTARLACRFGTTKPSHDAVVLVVEMLSTESALVGATLVDNSGTTAFASRRMADVGRPGKCCSTKWGLLAVGAIANMAAKSPLLRLPQAYRRAAEPATACDLRAIGRRVPGQATRFGPCQTARRLRPLARRAAITARPPRLFMRTRKPWVRARRVFEAW